MIDFIDGPPPTKAGHYWVRVSCTDSFTEATGLDYSVGAYCWKCACHPEEFNDLPERNKKSIMQGHSKITGYVELPNPKL